MLDAFHKVCEGNGKQRSQATARKVKELSSALSSRKMKMIHLYAWELNASNECNTANRVALSH